MDNTYGSQPADFENNDELSVPLGRSAAEPCDWSLWTFDEPVSLWPQSSNNGEDYLFGLHFPGFDEQFLTTIDDGAAIVSQAWSAEETGEISAPNERAIPGDDGPSHASIQIPTSMSGEVHTEAQDWRQHAEHLTPDRGRTDNANQEDQRIHHPTPSIPPVRHGRLSDAVRRETKELSSWKGACWRCKILRKKCDINQPCGACPRLGNRSIWQIVGCRRGRVKFHMQLCEYQPDSHKPPDDLLDRVLRCLAIEKDSQSPELNASLLNPGSQLREADGIWRCCFGHHDVHSSVTSILWELNRSPDGLRTLRLKHDDMPHLSEVLNAASGYEMELQDSKVVLMSLACLELCIPIFRLQAAGLLLPGLHNMCHDSQYRYCRIASFRHLQDHLQKYMKEISSVLFRKKPLQSDRRWWLAVWYSLYIQSFVRKALVAYDDVQAQLNHENKHREHCHHVLNLFIAASSGWDPLRQDRTLEESFPAQEMNDKKMIAHVGLARALIRIEAWPEEALSGSFAFLQREFENGPFELQQNAPGSGVAPSKLQTENSSSLGPDSTLHSASIVDTTTFDQRRHDLIDTSFASLPVSTPTPTSAWSGRTSIGTQASIAGAKRRANSPPEDNPLQRRSSISSLDGLNWAEGREVWAEPSWDTDASSTKAKSLSVTDTPSERAGSMSSMNSFSSINVAYGALKVNEDQSTCTTTGTNLQVHASYDRPLSPLDSVRVESSKTRDIGPLVPRQLLVQAFKADGLSSSFTCCPKKYGTVEELAAHRLERPYECAHCGNHFKTNNEKERHENSLHVRRMSWSCSALVTYDAAFHESTNQPGEVDTCGYCGEDFGRSDQDPQQGKRCVANEMDWEERMRHLQDVHKFRECNATKRFFRADHFRQHLKHSHAGTSGKWTNILQETCRRHEAPPLPVHI